MGNNLSSFQETICEREIIDFILARPDCFVDLLEDEFNFEPKTKRQRWQYFSREQWWETSWGRMLRTENLRDINHVEGKEFRRRFRLPAPFFLDWLVPECKKINIFGASKDIIPVEIKLLICLRLLARGNVVDDIVELSKGSNKSVRLLFKTFVTNFSNHFKKDFIRMPTGDELKSVLDVYQRLGFPGCVGSMDCTHVKWLCCPSEITNLCVGKEGYPTLSFQVVVDHARKINHVSASGFGTMNDINMCQVDVIVRNDKYGFLDRSGVRRNLYRDIEFVVYDQDGVGHKVKGGYLITDGGYEGLSIFVNPNVPRSDRGAIVWSEFIEAVRKDVECTFGILKARFHILKGNRFPEQIIVDCTIVTCCILHNMLLELDGYDISAWELDAAWESVSMSPTEWKLPVEVVNNSESQDQ